jgi:hypothetical protein
VKAIIISLMCVAALTYIVVRWDSFTPLGNLDTSGGNAVSQVQVD